MLELLESWNYENISIEKPALLILWQKLSNIPEKSLLRHNRKSIRAYDNKLQHNYDVTNFKYKFSN